MPPRPILRRSLACAVAASLVPAGAHAVNLGDDGLGQALIFPYYTVRASANGNAFNTYLSVVNTTPEVKALRVRVREGRAGREAISFNLYLAANDVWTGALAPTAQGARLLTADASCTDPPLFDAGGGLREIALDNFSFSGATADGLGDSLDRTREGFVEMIEMATLVGTSAAAVTHTPAGVPTNCAEITSQAVPQVTAAAPTGGLWGSFTLINVNNGQDFTLDATALANLSTRPFFRYPADDYPDFNAAEIDAVSVVTTRANVYRSSWSRAVDAVSAVLMSDGWEADYMLDNATASLTDWVATLPTRHHYVSVTATAPPFTSPGLWNTTCTAGSPRQGEALGFVFYNRDERAASLTAECGFAVPCGPPPPPLSHCAAAGVASIRNGAAHLPEDTTATAVLGSTTRGLLRGSLTQITIGFQHGWGLITPFAPNALTSLPGSTRIDLATGERTEGPHTFKGLPVVGFGVRTFTNGTLACTGAGACQGNYGSAFPFRYRRSLP